MDRVIDTFLKTIDVKNKVGHIQSFHILSEGNFKRKLMVV